MSKKEFLTSLIVAASTWLSARSVRICALQNAVVERLFVSEQMVLPPARPQFTDDELLARLDDFNEAMQYVRSGQAHGRVVITVRE